MPQVKGSRRERAEATRRRILHAAHREFVEKGYHGATIASIAAQAGVAPQTIYYVFNTKAAVISAVIDLLVLGEEEPVAPQDAAWWHDMVEAQDAESALRAFVHGAAALLQRASALSEILRAAALTDEEVRRTHDHHEQMRAAGYREVVELLADKGRLRRDLTIDRATDVLLVVFGDSTYQLLTQERGWSHDAVVAWFDASLPTLLMEAGA